MVGFGLEFMLVLTYTWVGFGFGWPSGLDLVLESASAFRSCCLVGWLKRWCFEGQTATERVVA